MSFSETTGLEFSADEERNNLGRERFATSIICLDEFLAFPFSMFTFDDDVVEVDDDELFGVNLGVLVFFLA